MTQQRITQIIEQRTRDQMLRLTADKRKPAGRLEKPWPKVELKREKPPPMTRTVDDVPVPYQVL